MPAVHDLASGSGAVSAACVIHCPQPLMDSIQILLPRSPLPNVMIHIVAESRFLLAAKAPDTLYLCLIFFPGSQFSPSLIYPFSFRLHPCLSHSMAPSPSPAVPLPTWPGMLLRDRGAGYGRSCGDGKVVLGDIGTAPPQFYLLQRGAKST